VLIAIVDIKEMPPLPFTVVYGTHGTWVLAYWPNKKKQKTIRLPFIPRSYPKMANTEQVCQSLT